MPSAQFRTGLGLASKLDPANASHQLNKRKGQLQGLGIYRHKIADFNFIQQAPSLFEY